ncbi:MFS transporter [Heyndrickxia sporothermodurans]|uniref:MFS transporter n=1 Tax=Heyndrickxia vini TaxID=1476025 RepID=A0ABX7E2E2_9BACI|nr:MULTISPECIES: MFS transporter [Heyndrickxia]MEB6550945.1 MFS transporter [Heyndrickxia sporothermodurans]QQZ09741.1 MFS transporter [Heyndrickxia vini]
MIKGNRNVLLILVATSFNFLGNGMHLVAISWLIYEITKSPLSVAFLVTLQWVPGIVSSFFTGSIIDNLNRKYILICMDIIRCITVLSLPILFYSTDSTKVWVLYAATVIITICSNFFHPAQKAILKEVIPEDIFLRVVSFNSTILQLGAIVGAGSAGFLISMYSPYAVFLIDSCTFLISAVLLSFLQYKRLLKRTNHKVRLSFYKDLKIGASYLFQRKVLFTLYLMGLIPSLVVKIINSLLSSYTDTSLHMGVKEYGILDSAFAVGSVVTGLYLVGFVKKGGMESTFYNYSFIGIGLSLLMLSIFPNYYVAIIGMVILGATTMFEVVSRRTLVMKSVDENYMGRVEGFYWMIVSSVTPLGNIIASFIADFTGSRAVILSYGLIMFIIFVTLFKGGKRNFITELTKEVDFNTIRKQKQIESTN